jgi:DNA-directed RNA polymerase subunit RPC12/RpoP
MKEFTFNCPTCGQPILATKDWTGRPMNCPSCETRIVIPARTQVTRKKQRITAAATTEARPRRDRKRPPGFL